MFKKNSFLIISVLLHLIVLYVLTQSVMFPTDSDSPVEKPEVIQATLVFDFPLPPVEIPIEVVEEETPEESQIEPIAEPEVQTPSIKPQPLPKLLPPKPKEEIEEEVEDEPEQSKESNEVAQIEINKTPIPNSVIRAPITNMARRHLNSFQQQQQNSMAEQASRRYQQRKNSPVIDDKIKDPFMSEDEKFRDKLKVRADCSNTSKKTAAVLLGFLGSTVDCSKPPPINGFINKRLNKEPIFPGQHRQEHSQRPKSVVIEKQH